MTSVPADQQGVFVINVFTVPPENQQRLIDCIINPDNAADLPGLLSIRVLRSLDGTRVINHMHWESQAAFAETAANSLEIAAAMKQVQELVEGADFNQYEIVHAGP